VVHIWGMRSYIGHEKIQHIRKHITSNACHAVPDVMMLSLVLCLQMVHVRASPKKGQLTLTWSMDRCTYIEAKAAGESTHQLAAATRL
jgi:hypothetical protein